MPAWAVMSRNWMVWAAEGAARARERRRKQSLLMTCGPIVMRVQVFGVDREDGFECLHGIVVLALQELDAPEVVEGDAVAGILREDVAKTAGGFVVFAFRAQNAGVEIIRAGEVGIERERLLKDSTGGVDVAFLQGGAPD